jgi:hypothetical protein
MLHGPMGCEGRKIVNQLGAIGASEVCGQVRGWSGEREGRAGQGTCNARGAARETERAVERVGMTGQGVRARARGRRTQARTRGRGGGRAGRGGEREGKGDESARCAGCSEQGSLVTREPGGASGVEYRTVQYTVGPEK